MSSNAQPSRRDVRRLLALGALVVVLVAAGGAALLTFASHAVDDREAHEERRLVERTLTHVLDKLASDLTTISVWNQAYNNLRPGGDDAWMDEEIGTYLTNNRDYDLTLVLDEGDRPFYAYTKSGRTPPAALERFASDTAPLLRTLRRTEFSGGDRDPRQLPTAPELAVRARGVVLSQGVYYLVVASTVTPQVWSARRRPGPAVAVIAAQRMDRGFLDDLNAEMRIDRAAIVAQPRDDRASLPLIDAAGATVGSVSWQPRRPGLAVLRDAAPMLVVGFLILLAAAMALAARMGVIIRRLDANEASLSQAVADLMRARDEARAASRAKSEFLANMSHEIRTPLNGVLGMAQVMARHPLSPDQAERLQLIRDAGKSLLDVLNDVLDVSKIESGKLELERRAFDLEEAVHAACDVFASQARQKDLSFEIAVAPGARGAWIGDVLRLRQVLSNLVSNAVKFTTEGVVAVHVTPSGQGLAFQVRDTGVGIPADHLPRLFEKFSQADSSTTRKFGGTGLGLAISRELVTLMGGRLTVVSALGRGSSFTFELPLERSVLAPRDDADERPAEHVAESSALRILAAEDNAMNRLILTALLEPLDVELTLAENGLEAVAAFRTGRYDVILMDAQMPEMSGLEATEAIRALEAEHGFARTPIIALTANVMSHQVETYLAAGMDGCVAKPLDSAKLFKALDEVLSERPASGGFRRDAA